MDYEFVSTKDVGDFFKGELNTRDPVLQKSGPDCWLALCKRMGYPAKPYAEYDATFHVDHIVCRSMYTRKDRKDTKTIADTLTNLAMLIGEVNTSGFMSCFGREKQGWYGGTFSTMAKAAMGFRGDFLFHKKRMPTVSEFAKSTQCDEAWHPNVMLLPRTHPVHANKRRAQSRIDVMFDAKRNAHDSPSSPHYAEVSNVESGTCEQHATLKRARSHSDISAADSEETPTKVAKPKEVLHIIGVPANDEQVVCRVDSMEIGQRELLATGRIGTKVGTTLDNRSVLMDNRGKLLCAHGEQISRGRRKPSKSAICACPRFEDQIYDTFNAMDPKFTYGLAWDETLYNFLAERRNTEHMIWVCGSVYIYGCRDIEEHIPEERIMCQCGKEVSEQIKRDAKIAEAVKRVVEYLDVGDGPIEPTLDDLKKLVSNVSKYDCACYFAWLQHELPTKADAQIEIEYKRRDKEHFLARMRETWGQIARAYPH